MSWEPQLGSQIDMLETRLWLRECFLGGSRGGGKTDVMLADYASDVKEWGSAWKGILFRKTYSQFGEIVDRSKEMFADILGADPAKCYNNTNMIWRFPNGAKLQFFHMKDDSDADKHLGLQYTWIGWDELPHWESDIPYKKLMACLRSAKKGIPLRVRATGNPGGPGLGWIKKRFKIPNDVRERIGPMIEDTTDIKGRKSTTTRMFIRSTTDENQIMLDAQPDYYGTLDTATEGNDQLAKAWIDGDFNVFFGKFFTTYDENIHVIDTASVLPNGVVPSHWRLYGCLDYGEVSPTAFYLVAVDPDKNAYVVGEYYQGGKYPDAYAGDILDAVKTNPYTKGRRPEKVFADTAIFSTRATATAGSREKYVSDILRRNTGLNIVRGNKDRLAGWRLMKNKMAWESHLDELGRSTGKFKRKPSLLIGSECLRLMDEIEHAVHAGGEDNPKEDMDSKGGDHGLDALRYGLMGIFAGRQEEDAPESSFMTMKTVRDHQKKGWGNKTIMVDPTNHYKNILSFEEILDRAS